MPFSSGTMTRLYNWQTDSANGINITDSRMDAEFDGIATALSSCLLKDGTQTVTANIPMSTYKFTGLGSGSARTDSINAGQLQDGLLNWIDGGGTADAITATYAPAITALVDGQLCFVRATAANATTTPTFAPSGLTARTIVKNGGVALAAGDIVGDGHQLILRYDLANTRWELLNPKSGGGDVSGPASSTADALVLFNGTGGKTIKDSTYTITAAGAALLDDASASAQRTTLGLVIGTDVLAPTGSGASLTGVDKPGLQTIWIPSGAMRPTTSNGCASLSATETTAGRPDLIGLAFDASVDEHAQFQVSFPKSWDEGTVTFRVWWWSTATDTDGVAWALQGVSCADGDTADVAYGTAVVVTDAAQSTSEDVYVTDISGAVTIAGTPAAGDITFFRIFRDVSDAADTAAEDCILLGVQILYTTDAGNDA